MVKGTHEASEHILVDHKGADGDDLPCELSALDFSILLVEKRHKLRAVVSSVAFCGEDEPEASQDSGTRQHRGTETHSRLWYCANS